MDHNVEPGEYLKLLPAITESDKVRLHQIIDQMAEQDITDLEKAGESYGDSWCKRGGPGAWMVTVRKFDRLENQLKEAGWDIFKLLLDNTDESGPRDDIADLRRYLILISAYVRLVEEK